MAMNALLHTIALGASMHASTACCTDCGSFTKAGVFLCMPMAPCWALLEACEAMLMTLSGSTDVVLQTGIGTVHRVPCGVATNDRTVTGAGGTMTIENMG